MAIDLATGFNIGSKDAIDERQVLTLEQMKNLDESIYPDKYFAICKDDSMLYVYNVNNPVDADTGKFRKVSSNESVDPSIFQKSNDDSLITEDKTIVGAINELKTGVSSISVPTQVSQLINDIGYITSDEVDLIKEYNPDETYNEGQICLYNNYVWLCKTITTGAFEETKWEKQTDNITELDLDTIKTFLGLTPEQLETMADIISSEIRLDKVFSSSETYTRIDNALKEAKQYCVSQLAQKSTGSFKIVTSVAEVTDGNYLYLIMNDDTSKYDIYALADGNVEKLTTVEVNLDNYFTKSEIEADYLKKEDADGKYATITNLDDKVNKANILTTLDGTVTDEQVASALLTKTELDKTNAKLGDKADKTELNKRREIRVGEIYNSNSYYRVDAIGYYARPLYFRVVSTNGGEEILSFGQSVTSERKVIGKSVNATFKYIPPTENASNGTLFIKTNKADTSVTIFYTQIYSVASIPTLRDSTAEEYATGTDFNVQELATKTYVTDKINEASLSGEEIDLSDYQKISDISLTTTDKTIVGAINEVKDNVDNHTHNIADVNGLQFALDRKALKDHKHSYNDLNDKPTIPTKVSELENDRGYLTSIPKEYITESELKTKVLRVFYDEREINEAHGTNISLVVGEDNTEKIINVLEPHEEFINWFGNATSTDRFGIDESMGIRLNVVSIQKCTRNEGFAYAITNEGKLLSRFFQDGVLSKWDYDSTNLTEMNTKISQLETQVSDLFQSVSDGKTLVANAITDKGVSTATNATFATMATNISNITTTYKEETKSYNNTSSSTNRLVFTFSAKVSGVKQITPPYDISCYIVPETETNMFTINGKELILYVNGTGTWKVTAFIE